MSKRNIIRVGDRVKIVNPEKFIRCGYPFDVAAERDRIMSRHAHVLHTLINVIDPKNAQSADLVFNEQLPPNYPGLIDVAHALAKIVCVRNGFGGRTRAVHTERVDWLTGVTCEVHSKRVVKTGEYFAPSGGYDSWVGEHYYEPGGLTDEKTHVILTLQPLYSGLEDAPKIQSYGTFEIASYNTEKLT